MSALRLLAASSLLSSAWSLCATLPAPRRAGGGTSQSLSFFVSPSGDDGAPGTLAAPFRTPARALNATRALPRPITADVRVQLRSGLYPLTAPLTLLPGDGGDGATGRILWSRADGDVAPAVLSGGVPVSGWAAAPGLPGVLVAPLPAALPLDRARQLWVRGERRWLARVPAVVDSGAGRADVYSDASTLHYASSLSGCGFSPPACYPQKCPASDALGFIYNRSDARGPAADWLTQGGAVDIMTFGSWTAGYAQLGSIDAGNATLLTRSPLPSSPGQFGGLGCPSGGRWVALNVKSALAPGSGDFYVDDSTRTIFYAPRAGEAADSLDAVMPALDSLLVVAGDDCGGPVAWAAFSDLNFSFTTDGGARLTHGTAPHGAIEVTSALHFNLTRLGVAHLGGSGVLLLGTSRGVTVDGCDVRDAGGDGFGAIAGATDSNVDTTIINCIVEGTGHIFMSQPAGMRIMGNGDMGVTTVAHNLVRDTPYAGISIGWHSGAPRPAAPAPWRYNISHNLVEDIGNSLLNDFGGIYVSMGSPGYVCEDTDSCYIPTLVEHNLVRRVHAYNWAGNGAYTDENVAGVSFVGNAFASVSHVGIYLHCGLNQSATNNILYSGDVEQRGQTALFGSCNTGGVAPKETNISAVLRRNIFFVTGAASTLFDGDELVPVTNVSFDENVYWRAPPLDAGALRWPPGNANTFAQWQALGEDAHSIVADPLITRPAADDAADWTLLPASPALARGFAQLDLASVGPQRE